jgi:hypothetical protein
MSFPFNYGMSIYMPPGPDMDRVDRAWGSLGSLLESRQNDKDTNSVAQMAAERMRSLGPQGEQWAKMIQSNPRAALASMEQYGGPMEIENQIIGARAQGEAQERWGRALEGSELKPEELQIMLEAGPVKGPAALKAYREAGPKAPTQRERKLGNGMVQREEFVNGQWVPVGEPGISGGGMSFEIDANGNPVLRTGGAAMLGVSRPSLAKIEGKQIDMQDTLARLDSIRSSFRPEFQEFGTRIGTQALQWRASAGMPLSESEKRQIADFASFKASAFENASMILNQLSGAAISESEAARLMQFLPNAGTGAFDGDDPITFKRKLDEFDSKIRSSLERYAKQKGVGLDAVPPRAAQPQPQATPTYDELMSMSPGETFVDSEGITVRKTDRVDANGEPIFEDVD